MILIDLSKPQELDASPKAKQQINFTGNLDQPGNTTRLFIIEEALDITLLKNQNLEKNGTENFIKCCW